MYEKLIGLINNLREKCYDIKIILFKKKKIKDITNMPKQNHFIFNIIHTRDELKTALDGAI